MEYNIHIRIFRYMVYIWERYERQREKDMPDYLATIIANVFRAFLRRENVPQEEAESLVSKVKEKKMGELFANMNKMDIQAERHKTAETEKKSEEAEKKAEKVFEPEIRKTFTQFIKFGMIGISNVIISYVFYSLAIKLNMHYIIANLVGYLTSICNAFYWNNKWVFKKKTGEIRNIIKAFVKMVISYAGTGILLNSVLLSIWIEVLGISDMVAPMFNIVITTLLNFMLNKCWVFTKNK